MPENTTNRDVSSVDKITTYAVENVTLEDLEGTEELFYFEVVEGSEETVEIPDASDVIKVNLL